MNHFSQITLPQTDLTRAELNALIAALDEKIDAAHDAHHWTAPTWSARTYLRQMQALAFDCLAELDGEDPDSSNPQAELADMLDDACLSIHNAMQRHMAAMAVRSAA